MKSIPIKSIWIHAAAGLLLAPQVMAQGWADRLNGELKDHAVTLRSFYSGKHLRFGADGKLLQGGKPGPWTVYAKVQVRTVVAKTNGIEIDGRRLGVAFQPGDDKGQFVLGDDVRIQIDLPQSASWENVADAMHQVFLSPNESVVEVAPAAWRSFLLGKIDKQGSRLGPVSADALTADGRPVRNAKLGNAAFDNASTKAALSAPKAITAPDPDYEPFAKVHKYQATSVLWCVINEQGEPENIKIVGPAGLGLDERAVAAVSKWKFKPSTSEGRPVPVQINIEVNFRLY